jgi:hypothetical protein
LEGNSSLPVIGGIVKRSAEEIFSSNKEISGQALPQIKVAVS